MIKVQCEVQSQDEAERADAVVCMLAPEGKPLLMDGNLLGVCSECKRRVQHRPHIPVGPILLCIECCPPSPHNRNFITPATLQEWMKRSAH
jgi:hypothetical protein